MNEADALCRVTLDDRKRLEHGALNAKAPLGLYEFSLIAPLPLEPISDINVIHLL